MTTGAFIANEVKDEVASQATGGLSDIADVSKQLQKGLKNILDTDLFAFGNASGPRHPRIGTDVNPDANGMIKGQDGNGDVTGASTFDDPSKAPISGQFHKIDKGTELPDGLGVKADGVNVGGKQPAGHQTIYNKSDMSAQEFLNKFLSIPSTHAGKKNKSGTITWKNED